MAPTQCSGFSPAGRQGRVTDYTYKGMTDKP